MRTNKLIGNWKSADIKTFIGSSCINKDAMATVQGGGNGYIKTISGECNKSGESCFKILRRAAAACIT